MYDTLSLEGKPRSTIRSTRYHLFSVIWMEPLRALCMVAKKYLVSFLIDDIVNYTRYSSTGSNFNNNTNESINVEDCAQQYRAPPWNRRCVQQPCSPAASIIQVEVAGVCWEM